jgi:predicted dehydrogenase
MKILIVGGGSIGKRHIRNLKTLGYKDIFCLKRKHDLKFSEETQVEVLCSYSEAEKAGIDAVIICTPTALHNEAIKFGVGCNAAIFVEKPLIHSWEGLKTSETCLQEYKNVFFIGFMLRYHPLVLKIKEIIDSNLLGKIFNARLEFGSYLPYWHPWENYKISYASRKELGGGVINTITHELDLIQYFFGNPKSLICQARNFNKLGIEVEEICEAIFNYEDKIVSLHLDYLQKDYDRNIKILFDEGKLSWSWHENKVIIKKHNEQEREIILENFDVNQLYLDELKDFFELIKNKKSKHSLDKNHAFQNTKLMLLMHKSNEEKSTVTF